MAEHVDTESKRLSVTLEPKAVRSLEYVASGRGQSYKDVIADALWLQEQLARFYSEGGKLILRHPDGAEERLLLRLLDRTEDESLAIKR